MVWPIGNCTVYTVRLKFPSPEYIHSKYTRALSERYPACGLRIYVTGDGADVYQDTLFRLAKSQGTFQPVLILVGIRLGIDRVTPAYWSGLQMALQLPQSMGIAGYFTPGVLPKLIETDCV